jgi:hypothetical protein
MSDIIRYSGAPSIPDTSFLATRAARRNGERALVSEGYVSEVAVIRRNREMATLADEMEMRDFAERGAAVLAASRMRSTCRLTNQAATAIEDIAADVEERAQRVPTAAPLLANLYREVGQAMADNVVNYARHGR